MFKKGAALAKDNILMYRRFLSGYLLFCGSLFQRLQFNRHLEDVFQGFDLMLFGKGQHIGVLAIFVWIFIVMRQSIPESLV